MTIRIQKRICFLLLAALSLFACNLLPSQLIEANQSVAAPVSPTRTVTNTATPLPSPTPAIEQVISPPITTASQPSTTDTVASELLTHQSRAMLPAFAGDVEQVAASGASRYIIEVDLKPDSLDQSNTLQLSGNERIFYTNTETDTLSELYFRLYPNLPGYGGRMRVQTVTLNNQVVTTSLEANDAALRVALASPLSPGDAITISLTYSATVPSQAARGYNIFSYTDGTAALAGFYPAVAVYDRRGWDVSIPPAHGDATYLDVSLYDVQVTVPEEMVVAATGSTIDTRKNDDGTKTITMVSGPVRDFYMAMRPDYAVISDNVDGITVNSYYRPDAARGGTLALQYAVDALRVFNQQFGPYPYAEFDVVATPTTAGGIEYPGIIVVAQGLYRQQGGFFQHVVVHEVAHQWWYGLVGNDQVHEPWLDEALTNYSTIMYWEQLQGQEVAEAVVDQYFAGPYLQAQRNGQDRAVIGPVSGFSEAAYGAIVYGKGALFFAALRQEVGEAGFADIMHRYLANHKYGIAQADDLYSTIENVSGLNLEPLRQTWLLEP